MSPSSPPPRPQRPPERYQRAAGPVRRVLLGVLAVLAYGAAAVLTVVVLRDLRAWGVLPSGAIGLVVALLVVVGRTALTSLRTAPSPGRSRPAQGGTRPRR